jgi:hypothetical protein
MKEIFNYKSTHVYIKNINNFKDKTSTSIKAQLRTKNKGNGLRKVLTANEEPKDLKNKGLR